MSLSTITPSAFATPTQAPLQAVEQVDAKPAKAGTYLVRLAEPPVVAYDGDVPGLKATKPAKGAKVNPRATDVVKYVDHLKGKQDAALARAGGGKKLYNYAYSFNGFAAELSASAASKLATTPGVIAVTPDERLKPDTSSTPQFLGLTEPDGLWAQLSSGTAGKKGSGPGEDVIVGIVDTGIWPEHPSFSARDAAGKLAYQQIPGWHGACVPGEEWNASLCNGKIIGAQYFNAGFGGNAAIDAAYPEDFNSARDADGHGTHTASTAAGNSGVEATGQAAVFGTISGMAPRARVAAYKVCWGGDAGGCATSDSVAAIDQAVADGVDVINFSISGSLTSALSPVEVAFLFAADAGVFVAASAGNSGPATSTVAHNSPWLTTVAAGTHNRDGRGSVTLGNGTTYEGASVATPVGPAPLVNASAVGLAGADPSQVALCYSSADGGNVLDPAKVAGKIVVCDRGVTGRVNKSLAVQEAGGVGMILVNTSASSINADFHFVPTVHLTHTDAAAVKAYAATDTATATINQSTIVFDAPAPYTASFSSRGPSRASADLLKPDLIAPGQDILAGVSPVGNHGRLFDLLSGTSMSSPHVAGLAALLRDLHPDWSPMAIKSALMTTGGDVLDGPNTDPTVIFRQGAGHVRPNDAADPGLVYDADWDDWFGFLCGTELASCADSAIDPSDYNNPSIAIGALAGAQTVTRRVTNVTGAEATYTPSVTGLAGVTAVVEPSSLTLAPGQTKEFTVSFTRTTAPLNAYVGGQLTWSDGTHDVRIPLVVRPVALAAPAEVSGTGGPISYPVGFGYTGPFAATPRGLVPSTATTGTVTQDPDQTFDPASAAGTVVYEVTIPAGSTYARFGLFDAAAGTDLDLYVYQGSTLVGISATGTSDEQVSFAFGSPTTAPLPLKVYVHGWGVPAGSTPFTLHEWYLGTADAGNMTVSAPATATLGGTGTVELTFSGLAAGTRYLGSVSYSGATGMPAPTIVRVDTP